MRHLAIIFTLLFLASPSYAILISNISGRSNVDNFTPNATTNNGQIVIYGGLAGNESGETSGANLGCDKKNTSNTVACDNCGSASYGESCNQRRIYESLQLKISFTSPRAGIPKVFKTATGGSTADTPVTPVENFSIEQAANTPITISILWSTLCTEVANSSCETITDYKELTGTFKVGIDATGTDSGLETGSADSGDDYVQITIKIKRDIEAATAALTYTDKNCGEPGLCQYSLFPGDQKAYIENIRFGSGTGGTNLARLHMLCSNDESIKYDMTNLSFCAEPIVIVNNSALEANIIDGLINDTNYYFAAAVEDKAGNIGYFTNPTQDSEGDADGTGACPTGTGPECHKVTPSEVAGLFADKANCFIATAAYGSILDPHVDTLRIFRDRVLLKTSLGKKFVIWYYRNSPPWAEWISQSPSRRLVTRVALTPAFVLAYGILNWQWTMLAIVLLLGFYFLRRRQLRKAN